jgi:hypothetical protein
VLYLGLGSVSGIVHIVARLPFVARAILACAVLVVLCR